jgi:hypothetical protein
LFLSSCFYIVAPAIETNNEMVPTFDIFCLLVDDEPTGTAFAISNSLVLTAFHNLAEKKSYFEFAKLCLEITLDVNGCFVTDKLIEVRLVQFDTEEDWAVLERVTGSNSSSNDNDHAFTFADIALNSNVMPKINNPVTVAEFAVGLLNTSSTNQLSCSYKFLSVIGFESRKTPPPTKNKKVKLVETMPDVVIDAIKLSGGGFNGSCGAPFCFNSRVIAFHTISVNDNDNDSVSMSSHQSHRSWSIGHVLYMLPNFYRWYTTSVKVM